LPTRLYLFTPGALVPGDMTDEVIRQIEQHQVRYLLWSNRKFPEYGTPVFGVDFDRTLGNYFKSHYQDIGPVLPNDGIASDWTADVWERKEESGL
jgi:hypothetical protein